MKDTTHFKHIYWFAVGLCIFAAGLSIYVIRLDKHQIPMVLTFWLSSAASGAIGYVIGASINKAKQSEPGMATADISASITTEAKEQ